MDNTEVVQPEEIATEPVQPEETPKEIALKNALDETQKELLKLKDDFKKLKISNEELTLKIGLNRGTNTDEIFKYFSKYHKQGD